MDSYWISRVVIKQLWGHKDFDLRFNRDVNILIGPNASGKTTVLNLISYVFRADIQLLSQIQFDEMSITLSGHQKNVERTIKVSFDHNIVVFRVGRQSYKIDMSRLSDLRSRMYWRQMKRSKLVTDLAAALLAMMPIVWLPVSRRLPVFMEDDGSRVAREMRGDEPIESVDERLRHLLGLLATYRLKLEAQLTEKYKAFERTVLGITLFDKEHDKFPLHIGKAPGDDDRRALERAFRAAGLWDSRIEKRIREHFQTADQAYKEMTNPKGSGPTPIPNNKVMLIVPLIPRTMRMVDAARQLETEREEIFASINKYKELLHGFLQGKLVELGDHGELVIRMERDGQSKMLNPDMLSSGEKQIAILLTQALVQKDAPALYIADEPELSLHVMWQEKLISSIRELGPEFQIIVATHSPDIVGPYSDKVISLTHY